MEYLGGGSALDLVSRTTVALQLCKCLHTCIHVIIRAFSYFLFIFYFPPHVSVETGTARGDVHRHNTEGDSEGAGILAFGKEDSP